MSKKIIAYVGAFQFPYGQAASKRVKGNILLLESLGYEVIVGHGGDAKEELLSLNNDVNIKSYGLGELYSSSNRINRLFNLVFNGGNNTVKWLKQLKCKPDSVIVYGGFYHYSNKILKYCKANNIKVIFDVVEWYEPAQMIGGRFGLFYNSFLIAFKYVYPKANGIIAISSNLGKVFKNSKVIVIPPLLSDKIDTPCLYDDRTLSLIYAGNIGNKDSLIEIIQIVDKLSLNYKIKLDIFGPNEEEVKSKYNLRGFTSGVKIHGKVKQEEINNYIMKADFTIFVRPDTHCNHYGFPSKFVESLSLGVPVATNLTSDIGLYLKDGYNGFVIENSKADSIETVIMKMLNLTSEDKMAMKMNAIKTAEESFSSKSLLLRKKVFNFFSDIDYELT